MTKYQYLAQLESSLAPVDKDERREIMSDIAEHFDNELRLGRTEQQIAAELGDPQTLARSYTDRQSGDAPVSPAPAAAAQKPYSSPFTEEKLQKRKKASPAKIVGMVFADIALVLGVVILFSLIISGFATAFALAVAGIAYLIMGFIGFTSIAMGVGVFLASVGVLLLGIFLFRVFISATKGSINLVRNVIKKQGAAIRGEN